MQTFGRLDRDLRVARRKSVQSGREDSNGPVPGSSGAYSNPWLVPSVFLDLGMYDPVRSLRCARSSSHMVVLLDRLEPVDFPSIHCFNFCFVFVSFFAFFSCLCSGRYRLTLFRDFAV